MMNWLFCNIRGVNKRYKHKEVREYIRENKIKLVDLVETKVKEGNAQRISKAIILRWSILTNYKDARNGRIWLLWDTSHFSITGIKDDAQMIHVRFFNIWAIHEDFSQIVASMWNSHSTQCTLKSVWTRLTDLKPALKALNSREFRGITQKIEKARIDLRVIQEQISLNCNDALLDMEKKTLLNLEKWSLIEESVLQQKVRARWIQLGDSNSKYFTAVMKDRTQRKQITEITTLLGDKLTDPKAIKRKIVDFYKRLMGSAINSLPAINRSYMKNGHTLSHQQRVDLCAEVTNQEIVESLKAIGDDKASVPKVTKPTTVKEYRPIACCSILYKMISKILASRLQKVMSFIICEAQAGFIPGRKIADNVILAHELVKSYTRAQMSPRCMIKIDLQKAYDSVEWIFLQRVMEEIGFPDRKALVAWEKICTPKSAGGLNLINLPLWNKAAIAKT
ncbi:uncharacterized protein LOC142168789 [Nicotiana tabacum]|uniref:Uncharacterized protein LOC142168789 n=1 Tax=Nicotiana tabacum TaxID=4097 RepID=A0AC58SM49_TOBAC